MTLLLKVQRFSSDLPWFAQSYRPNPASKAAMAQESIYSHGFNFLMKNPFLIATAITFVIAPAIKFGNVIALAIIKMIVLAIILQIRDSGGG